jgi:hypothetical protein
MSTLKADTIQSTGGGAATLTGQQAAKLTLHYDQYNGPTVLSSHNVASVTDVATGQWEAIPTSSFSSVDAIQCYSNSQPVSTNDGSADYWRKGNSTASKLHMRHFENGTTFDSPSNANVAHGDLA